MRDTFAEFNDRLQDTLRQDVVTQSVLDQYTEETNKLVDQAREMQRMYEGSGLASDPDVSEIANDYQDEYRNAIQSLRDLSRMPLASGGRRKTRRRRARKTRKRRAQ